jgi:Tol biopolymer transport system component
MIGTRLGPYEITAKLGEGGMGEVYRATDSKLRREVAIKVLPAAFTEDKERLARFEREAQLLAQLHHPNIASIFGLEESGGGRALVMELVDGPTLSERLAQGALPLEEALAIARQIAEALEAAHEKGIVHRDLKPQNIKLAVGGTVKVLDFGLAKALDPAGSSSAADAARSPTLMDSPTLTAAGTRLGMILGTAAYMAPEQAKGAAVDKRADIWAFGVVLFEILRGRRLFSGDSAAETLAEVLKAPIPLDDLVDVAPAAICQLVGRCLERNPKNRLHDIADARIVLDEVIRGGGAAELAGAGVSRARVPRRELVAWVGLAACALALGLFLWRRPGVPPPTVPRFTKITYAPQFISNARFAPDGRTVVLSAALQGNNSALFVRRPEDPQPRVLGRSDLQLLAVSSKGEVALLTGAHYLVHRTYLGTLARMPIADASPREILESVTAADWSPDGAELAVIRQVEGKSRLEYPAGKTLAESNGYLSDVRVSPKGDRIAFMPHAFANDNRGPVVVVDRSGAEITRSPEYWGGEGIAWSADGETVLFSASARGDDYSILALAMDGTTRDVLTAPARIFLHDATADGKLLLSTSEERAGVFALLPGATSERELPWLDQSSWPILSRDGRSLLFGDETALSGHLYSVFFRAADGSPPVRLGDGFGSDLSPDGTAVVALVMGTPPRLMIYPTGPGEPRDISVAGLVSYEYESARFLRDGRSVSVCGTEAGEISRCWVRDLAGGPARAVTPPGTRRGRVSPDGTSAVARGPDGRYRRYAIDSQSIGDGVPVDGLDIRDDVGGWSADGRSLLVFRPGEIPARVDRLDLATGRRTVMRELAPADRAGVVSIEGISFSADETFYAYGVMRKAGNLFTVEGVR